MQLVTIDSREVAGRPGALTPAGEILDLSAAPTTLDLAQWIPQSVISILAAGEGGAERVQRLLDSAAEADAPALRAAGVLLPMASTRLMAPVRRPGLVLVLDSGRGRGAEPEPVAYIKSPNTVVGQATDIRVPWQPAAGLGVRPLLGVVLGRPLHLAAETEALAAIAAFTILMDLSEAPPAAGGSASDWRRYLDSKQFPGACPTGPALITADEFSAGSVAELELAVNGVEVARGERPLAELPGLIAALSRRYGFRPGDVIGFDLPADGADRRHFQDGDHLSLALSGLMTLEARLRF